MTVRVGALGLLGLFLRRAGEGVHSGGDGFETEIWCGFGVCNPIATQEQWTNVKVSAPEEAQVEKEPLERFNNGLLM